MGVDFAGSSPYTAGLKSIRPLDGARRETHLSAFQARSQAPARFPLAHGDGGRAPGDRQPPQEGSQASFGLNGSPPITMKPALPRLKRRRDFVRAAAAGRRAALPGLVLQACPRDQDAASAAPRIGFTVTRRVGNAVTRNRVRRRLRAVAGEIMATHAEGGHDYVLIGRAATRDRPYDALRRDLVAALKRLGHYHDDQGDETERRKVP